jgi:MFS family permease
MLYFISSRPSVSSKYGDAPRNAIFCWCLCRGTIDELWWYVLFLSSQLLFLGAKIAAGVIADIWDAAGRGPATSLFVACVFVGPVLGPIVGG